jgi:hypothetical protein
MHYLLSSVIVSALTLVTLQVEADDKTVHIDQAMVQAAGGFPFKITKPGNYRLNGNLHVPANANGIVIDADGVALNLAGFQLECAGGQNTGIFSDHTTTTYNNITVANGNVAGCWTGVDLSGTGNSTVEGLTVSGYGVLGIEVNAGAIRKSIVTGGSDPHSIGLGLSSGIVDSNFVAGGDYVGIAVYGSAFALLVGNVVNANYLAISTEPYQSVLAGSNTLRNGGTAYPLGTVVSQKNNLCNFTAC